METENFIHVVKWQTCKNDLDLTTLLELDSEVECDRERSDMDNDRFLFSFSSRLFGVLQSTGRGE